MKVKLHKWLALEAWGIVIGGYLGIAVSYLIYDHLLRLPASLVWFLLGLGGSFIVPTLLFAHYEVFRNRYVWRMKSTGHLGRGSWLRVLAAWVVMLVPFYLALNTYWDFFVIHKSTQGIVSLVLALLTFVGWWTLTRRIFRPIIQAPAPDVDRVVASNLAILSSSMKLFGVAALGGFCLFCGMYLLISGRWLLSVSVLLLVLPPAIYSGSVAQHIITRLGIEARWIELFQRDGVLLP